MLYPRRCHAVVSAQDRGMSAFAEKVPGQQREITTRFVNTNVEAFAFTRPVFNASFQHTHGACKGTQMFLNHLKLASIKVAKQCANAKANV